MIDTSKLTLIDGLVYALDDIKTKLSTEEWDAFQRYLRNKPLTTTVDGRKAILRNDLQMYIRLRTNALKSINQDKNI
jgi:hypothetical protein